jgi:integrase
MYEFLDITMKYDDLNIYQKHKADWLEDSPKYSRATKRAYWINLNTRVNYLEVNKNKELYNWDKEEIIQCIKTIPTVKGSSKVTVFTTISMYIAWAFKKGYNFVGNPCDSIDTSKLFTVNELAFRESYMELNNFYEFILDLDCTDVDRAMLTLLRYGVKVEDVGKVRWEDIDAKEKSLRIKHEDEEINYELELPIDNLFMMMINKAKDCEYRQMKNNPNSTIKEPKMASYVDYGYIVKAPDFVEWESMSDEAVYNRVGVISKANKIQRISVPDLNSSRKYDLLYDKVEKNNNVNSDDVEEVIKIFEPNPTYAKLNGLRKGFETLSGYPVERNTPRPNKKNKDIKPKLVEV